MQELFEQLVVFVTKHWLLAGGFAVVLLAWLSYEFSQLKSGGQNISPKAAVDLINHQDAQVIDLRSESAFMDGHILGAHSLPQAVLEKKMSTLQKYSGKPLILVSNPEQTLSKELKLLEAQGFAVFVLQGGVLAWREALLPLNKKGLTKA